MTTSRFSQRGQGTTTPMSISVFFIFYFTFILVLIWLVEGIVPMFLDIEGASVLILLDVIIIGGAWVTALVLEKATFVLTSPAPVAAWHLIHFAILGVVVSNVGWPLYDAVTESGMFTEIWLTSIFIGLPFIAFSFAMYQIIMGSGGA